MSQSIGDKEGGGLRFDSTWKYEGASGTSAWVNTHTSDRYHMPWDLGWGDKNISFYLIHLK